MRGIRSIFGCGTLLLGLCTCPQGFAQETLYVINGKKPSISIVNAEKWTVTASVALGNSVGSAGLDATGRFLYTVDYGVLEGMLSRLEAKPSNLSVIDLAEQKVVKTIPVPWRVRSIAFTEDGRYLIVSTRGQIRASGKVIWSGTGFHPSDGGDPGGSSRGKGGYLTVIDTRTATVKASVPTGLYSRQVLWTRDTSRIFVLTAGSLARNKNWPEGPVRDPDRLLSSSGLTGEDARLFVLGPESPTVLAEIPFDRMTSTMLLSRDEKWLYLLQPGMLGEAYLELSGGLWVLRRWGIEKRPKETGHTPARVLVIDASSGKPVATHDVGTGPRDFHLDIHTDTVLVLSQAGPRDLSGKLFRFRGGEMLPPLSVGLDPRFPLRCPGESGIRIVSTEDIRLLDDTGQWKGDPLVLNPLNKELQREGAVALDNLVAIPMSSVCLAKPDTLALLNEGAHVWLVDLDKGRPDEVRLRARDPLAAFAPGAVGWQAMAGVRSIASPPGRSMDVMKTVQAGLVSQGEDAGPSRVVPRPDGAFLYLFDGVSGTMGIVDVQKRSILAKAFFGTGRPGVFSPPGGKYVYCVEGGGVTLIDAGTIRMSLRHRIAGETIRQAFTRKQGAQLVVLTDNLLQAVDVESGKVLGTVKGLSEPGIVLEPRPASPR